MVIIMFAENILVYLVAIISRKLLHTEELNLLSAVFHNVYIYTTILSYFRN